MQAKITWYFDRISDDNEDREWLPNAYVMKQLHSIKYMESEIQFVIYRISSLKNLSNISLLFI